MANIKFDDYLNNELLRSSFILYCEKVMPITESLFEIADASYSKAVMNEERKNREITPFTYFFFK